MLFIFWALSLILAGAAMYQKGKLEAKQVKIPFHKVSPETQEVTIIEYDEYDGEISRVKYKRSSRWLSGFHIVKD